jgi:beta-glucanase (GH16 family)
MISAFSKALYLRVWAGKLAGLSGGRMRFAVQVAFASLCLAGLACGGSPTASTTPPSGWSLTWSDEFNSANGSAPDAGKWSQETGGNGWGNHELEYYTARPQNSSIQDGNLIITAAKETYTGSDGVSKDYTSARLKTASHFSQKYGRFESRIKIPTGKGVWPAFWMLGDNIDSVGWPECGEIDIMENIGSEPAKNHGSMHGPGYNGGAALTAIYTLPSGNLSDDFHVFAMEWEPSAVRFYVDDHLYSTHTPNDVPQGGKWVFDHPFFILLNVAVGGDFPGNPDATTTFPAVMKVDYVRVYSHK